MTIPSIEQVIAAIPDGPGAPSWPNAIPAGLTNTNWRVVEDGTPFFVRIPGADTELLAVDRGNEIHNTIAAATAGVAPRVVVTVPEWDVFALEWLDARTMSNEGLRAAGMPERRVIDQLWPDLGVGAALPRLHKAAHYARRALDCREAVETKDEVVALFPGAELEVDAIRFEAAADAALAAEPVSPADCAEALELAGELLPEDLVESWLEEPRERLRLRVTQLLWGARRWEDLLRADPADEEAHVELLRDSVARGTAPRACAGTPGWSRSSVWLDITPGQEAVQLRAGGCWPPVRHRAGRQGCRWRARRWWSATPSCWR